MMKDGEARKKRTECLILASASAVGKIARVSMCEYELVISNE